MTFHHAPLRNTLPALLALAMTLAACGEDKGNDALPDPDEQTFVLPTEEGSWILVDQIHTTKQNPDLKLERNNYNYQGMHGYHRLFKHLEANGYPYSQLSYTSADERLTPQILKGFKVLFINLVSDDRPDFTADEINTIVEFVRGGGGLFVIADHTNVYYHAERINPFLEPMGISVMYHTALDAAPTYALPGGAWLKIQNWDRSHPISQGLEIASFQTGGPFQSDHGIAFLSEAGHGDYWMESPENVGFYGNWTRDEGEPTGALPVVVAAQFGQGRVAVVGDQNIFGDEWLLMAHNFELATNTFEWLAGNDGQSPALRERRDPDALHVAFPIKETDWNIGVNYCSGFFPFYINFNRSPGIVARGALNLDGREDVIVLTDPVSTFDAQGLNTLQGHLDAGKPLVIMTDVLRARPGTRQLISQLVPDFAVTGRDGQTLTVDNLPATDATVETSIGEQPFLVSSDTLEVDGLRLAGHTYPSGAACPDDIAQASPYLRRVTASFGTPFLQATLEDGSVVDIARRVTLPSGGQIILFLQDGFWRNETLGKERQSPILSTRDAHTVQYRFLDWLETQKK